MKNTGNEKRKGFLLGLGIVLIAVINDILAGGTDIKIINFITLALYCLGALMVLVASALYLSDWTREKTNSDMVNKND